MKTIYMAIALCTTGFYALPAKAQSNTRIENLGWLVGSWNRTNSKPGHAGNERWLIDREIGLRGYGVTTKGSDTLFVEKMRIVEGDHGALYFVADVLENPKPTYFHIISVTQNEFTCENQAHDFPKMIHYERKLKNLEVTLLGNGRTVIYRFVKAD